MEGADQCAEQRSFGKLLDARPLDQQPLESLAGRGQLLPLFHILLCFGCGPVPFVDE